MKTKIFIIAVLCLIGYAFAQNQLPATAPADPIMQAKDALIVEKEMQIKQLQDQLKLERTSKLMPESSHPDFLAFKNIGDGEWKMWSRDPKYTFSVSSNRVLITLK